MYTLDFYFAAKKIGTPVKKGVNWFEKTFWDYAEVPLFSEVKLTLKMAKFFKTFPR